MERGSRWLPILRGELSRSPRCSKSARRFQAATQTPAGYPACAGCALLESKVWPERKYLSDYLGLGNWIYCNIECSYCELQTKGLAAASIAFEPYLLFETVRGLLEDSLLDRQATVDWGGGDDEDLSAD